MKQYYLSELHAKIVAESLVESGACFRFTTRQVDSKELRYEFTVFDDDADIMFIRAENALDERLNVYPTRLHPENSTDDYPDHPPQ